MFLKRKLIMKIVGLALVLGSVMCILVMSSIIDTSFTNPLNKFQGPNYMPDGYQSISTNTTSNEKILVFEDDTQNKVIVAAVKNLNESKMKKLSEPFKNIKTKGVSLTEEKIIINGHNVNLQLLKVEFMGLNTYMFHASWICDIKGLTIIATGSMKQNETETIKKMITTIKCHT